MEKITQLRKNLRALNVTKEISKTFRDKDIQREVIELNIDQLMEGTDSAGKQIRTYSSHHPNVYAYQTINIKRKKSQAFDKVTLRDTGKFHRSLRVKPRRDYAEVTGTTKKADGDINDNVNVGEVLGIAPESKHFLLMKIIPKLQQNIRDGLWKH